MTLLELQGVAQGRDDRLRDEITAIVDRLTGLPDLEPGPDVNRLLSRLVRLCVEVPGAAGSRVVSDPAIAPLVPGLRRLCGRAEYLLERHWARSVASAGDPPGRLAAFPYRANYEQLTELELHLLAGVGCDLSRLERICFLGGGPLPLSALLLGRRLDVRIDVVDRDREASSLAEEVIGRLQLSHRLHTWTAEALEFPLVAECDVLVLAALVGDTQGDKRRLLADLAERVRPGALLVVRGAHGLRTLLYPAVDVTDLEGWAPLALAHPFTEVVNSVLVARRR